MQESFYMIVYPPLAGSQCRDGRRVSGGLSSSPWYSESCLCLFQNRLRQSNVDVDQKMAQIRRLIT